MAYETLGPAFLSLIVVLAAWESLWKAIALWKSARNNQLVWFICIIIFNTAGIMPILYILFFQKKGHVVVKKSKK